jgi:uncharacterized membrane protein YkoI
MKKIIAYLSVLVVTCIFSCEDEHEISASQVPQPVMTAFQKKYPNITADKWVQEKEKGKPVYEAKFKNNNKDIEAEFDENGNFIEEE